LWAMSAGIAHSASYMRCCSPFVGFRMPPMVLKNVLAAVICAALFAWSSLSVADEYRAGEFLGLDLSKAVLSPKRLGPASRFTPVPIEARADRGSEGAQVRVEPKASPGIVTPKTRIAHMRADRPRGAARTKLARRHGNPLDAQAFDTRIQVWPCRSGGICGWKRQGN
jgi:hypothetical protein